MSGDVERPATEYDSCVGEFYYPADAIAYADARAARAVEAERARVVAWLRTMGQARIGEQYNDRMNACGRTYLAAAHAIEGGGHE